MRMESVADGRIFIVVVGGLFAIATLGCRSDSGTDWHILYDHPGQNGAETAAAVTGDDGERMSGNCTITDGSTNPPPNGIKADDVLTKTINGAMGYGMRYVEFNTTDIDNPDLTSLFVYGHQEFTK